MQKLTALLKREMIENRFSALWLPFGIGIGLVCVLLGALIWHHDIALSLNGTGIDGLASIAADEKIQVATTLLAALTLPFYVPLIFIVIFYLAHGLFDERKDRSILFWKSLPVSDHLTVASKLITAIVVIPACYWLAATMTQGAFLFVLTLTGQLVGLELWSVLWQPSLIFAQAVNGVVALLAHGLWLLPIYAWLLFCSSWAPRAPLMVAIAIVAIFSLFINTWQIVQTFNFTGFTPLRWVAERFNESPLPLSFQLSLEPPTTVVLQSDQFLQMASYFASPKMWVGWLIAAGLSALTILMRHRATA